MVYSDKVFVRWKPVVAVFPSLKYFYVYSHHCATASNQNSCPKISKLERKALSLIPLNSVKAKQSCSLAYHKHSSSKIDFDIPVVHKLYLNKRSSLAKTRIKNETSDFYKNNNLVENLLFGDSHLLPVNNVPIHHQTCNSSTKILNYKDTSDQSPADDPKQKIHLLIEKIRMEAPMLLGKTKPYHDFSIYSSSVELQVENAPNSNRIISRGLRMYKLILALYRRLMRVRLVDPDLEVLGIHVHEDHETIEVRWRISGWSRWGVLTAMIARTPSDQYYQACYDYNSTFYVNHNGDIWRHKVSQMKTLQNSVPLKHKLQSLGQNPLSA